MVQIKPTHKEDDIQTFLNSLSSHLQIKLDEMNERKQQTTDERMFIMFPVPDVDVLLKKEERKLSEIINEGSGIQRETAKELLIMYNLKLVASYVHKYYDINQEQRHDAFQEGVAGLTIAAERYDYKVGTAFSTYCSFWIKKRITEYINSQATMIKIPSKRLSSKYKIESIKNSLKNVDKPIDREEVFLIYQEKYPKLPLKEKDFLYLYDLELNEQGIYGKNTDADGVETTSNEVLPEISQSEPEAFKKITENQKSEIVNELLDPLDDSEKMVVCMFYGIGYDREYLYKEIAEHFDKTYEQIRGIKRKAFRKIQNNIPNGNEEFRRMIAELFFS